jgi:hypothetical protein
MPTLLLARRVEIVDASRPNHYTALRGKRFQSADAKTIAYSTPGGTRRQRAPRTAWRDQRMRFLLRGIACAGAILALGDVSLLQRDGRLDPIHSLHHALHAQAGAAAPAAPTGGLAAKPPHLVASVWTAASTVARTPLRHEWANVPLGSATLRTWIEYPEGGAPAPVVLLMQHGPGLDDWMLAAADQLAREGFIAVAPDLWSGLGPNGGGRESFRYTDEAVRAAAGKLTPQETLRRYRAAWDFARHDRLLCRRHLELPVRRRVQ